MMKRVQFGAAFGGSLVMLALAMPALAQDPNRIQLEISRTDDRIEQAESIVAGSNNERASLSLAAAVTLQAAAKRNFASSQFAIALRATLDARIRADAAIAIVRGQPDPERVHAQVERTRDLIERARPRVEECSDDRARHILRGAVEMHQRAEIALQGQRYLAALRLTLNARERVWRALRICHLQDDPGESAERALQRTDELMERATQEVADGGSSRAEAALRQAAELQARAWAEFRAGRPQVAVRLTHSARTAAHRAVRLAGGGR
ncbi:MAG: hypothetical protein ABIS67_12425 [Candidatus Eisenbacteria bacterium]